MERVNKKQYNGFYIGYVKDNTDAQKLGRLKVWIPEHGTNEYDPSGWILANYLSPFAGATNFEKLGKNKKDLKETQTSYGFWMIPPDLNNQVGILFLNGDPSQAFWIGCVFQPFMNNMVPGISGSKNNYHDKSRNLPISDFNRKGDVKFKYDSKYLENALHPIHSHQSKAISSQGLIDDEIRGFNNSNARREAPSFVYGLSTPGPYDSDINARMGGNQFILDDKLESEHITLKTRSGAQIRIDETNSIIYIINRKGTSWFQMDAEGNVDIFGAQSISLRGEKDLNIRADRDINIEAGRNINMKAVGDHGGSIGTNGSGDGGNFRLNTHNDVDVYAGNDTKLTSRKNTHIKAQEEELSLFSRKDTNILSGNNILASSTKNTTFTSDVINFDISDTYNIIAGKNIKILTESYNLTGVKEARFTSLQLHHNGLPALEPDSGWKPKTAKTSVIKASKQHTNILKDFAVNNKSLSDNRKSEPVLSIVDRFITYEPCPYHLQKVSKDERES